MKSRWGAYGVIWQRCCVLLFSSPSALGQAVNATLLGTVTDSSGAAVANVEGHDHGNEHRD